MITKEEIAKNVSSKPQWAERALVVLWERQTEEEKAGRHTNELNGRGFAQPDAELLSSFAEQVIEGRKLSARQLWWAYKKLPKYAGQLHKMAVKKAIIMQCACGQPIVADGREYRCLGCGYTAPRFAEKAA